jgi:hypothetical protein
LYEYAFGENGPLAPDGGMDNGPLAPDGGIDSFKNIIKYPKYMNTPENSKNQPSSPPSGAGGQHILMIRPVNFGFNEQTATSNAFQDAAFGQANKEIAQATALQEFDQFVIKLRNVGIEVLVINDSLEPRTPDSIFPNNWISFHDNGQLITYPMQAENRRLERRIDLIEMIESQFVVKEKIDLSYFEKNELYLEGTGSMVLDRPNKIAYACISPRTNQEVLNTFCQKTGYSAVCFDAMDSLGRAIYHTNVLMCVASDFVVICLDAIQNQVEKNLVINSIKKSGKTLVEISLIQMNNFAGNMLELIGKNNCKYLIMSSMAYKSLTESQLIVFKQSCEIIHSDLTMIEGNGGGSARCMMAEICLTKK